MSNLPPAIEELIEALSFLPGVGQRSAERYAYNLLKRDPSISKKLAKALNELHDNVGYCQKTYALVPAGVKYSKLYTDPSRDKTIVAVVADPFDVFAIEKTNLFNGTYHVLGGLISPLDNITTDQLKIKELIKRIDEDKVKEIILATNGSVEGESTALFIQQQLKNKKVKVSRLARGLPMGVDLEYADQITLGRAIEGRQAL